MKKIMLLTFQLTILNALIFISCSFFNKEVGNLKIYLKDQPIEEPDSIYVTINQIRVQKTEEAFITVSQSVKTYDLLKLKEKQEMNLN